MLADGLLRQRWYSFNLQGTRRQTRGFWTGSRTSIEEQDVERARRDLTNSSGCVFQFLGIVEVSLDNVNVWAFRCKRFERTGCCSTSDECKYLVLGIGGLW